MAERLQASASSVFLRGGADRHHGAHDQPYAGVTAAPAVASPSYSVNTDSGVGVRVREGPGTDWPIVGWVGDGDPVTIYCVGYDSAGRIWDHIGPGRYVLDEYVQTGQTTPVTRNCDLPNGGRPSSSQPVDEWTPEDQPQAALL